MCGIAGLVCLDDGCDGQDHRAIVQAMCDLQVHRGPDDAGLASRGRVCLGTRRLSIIDLSASGHMPMTDESGRWCITYNGEVYNFQALRAELEALGHRFRSRTDTEVVLHAYMEWGPACLHRLVGMFAFAIHDAATGEVVLVRDRYGIKPLYYARLGGHVLFGSEVKALLGFVSPRRVDGRCLMEWMLYRNVDVPTPETLVEGVLSVLPGQLVRVSAAGIGVEQYYSPTAQVSEAEYRRYEAARPEAVVDDIDAKLAEATRLRLVSDVPVGTLLSGGLDSSLVTAIAAGYTKHLTAFHVSVEGFPALDERRFAEQLAHSHGLPLVACSLTGELFRRNLARVIYHSDLPLSHPNSVAYYLISKVAREHGVIVLLSGEGADELFGGYRWIYRRKRRLLRLEPFLSRLPARLHDLLALVVYANAGMPVSSHRFRDQLPPTVRMLDRFARYDWQARCEESYGFVENALDRAVLGSLLADLADFLTPLLRRLDRTSMAASVECRVPYLDHRIVHTACNLPLDYRVGRRADKWVVKKVAERYLPRQLIERKKMGFPLPLDDYLAPLASHALFADGFCVNALGLSPRGIDHALESWRRWIHGFFGLATLELWGRLHVMGQPVEAVEEHIRRVERGETRSSA